MLTVAPLKSVIIGLLGFAAAEEQMLLAATGRDGAEPGSPARWAAWPLVAHNTEFRDQQLQRLAAIRDGRTPPGFAQVDHSSPEVYRRYCEQPAGAGWPATAWGARRPGTDAR